MARWKIALVATIIVGLSGWAIGQVLTDGDPEICFGVLPVGAPVAATESDAVAAYVNQRGGRPGDWRRDGKRWVPREEASAVPDYVSMVAGRGPEGWKVVGACAPSPARASR